MTIEQLQYVLKLQLESLEKAMEDKDSIATCAMIGLILADVKKLTAQLPERRKE